MLPISFIILTKNEEQNLDSCIECLQKYADDIHILDSHSTDDTIEIAKRNKINLLSNRFTGFGDQRNWAIDNIKCKYSWTFHIDADERLTPELAAELEELIRSNPAESGFYAANKLMLGDAWLKYSSGFPVYQVRLFHLDRLRFSNHGHGQREVTQGKLGYLKNPYLHYAFSKGLEDWISKHANYAAREATEFLTNDSSLVEDLKNSFLPNPVGRRRSIKRLAYRLPSRYWLRMFQLLVVNRGMLDGKAGMAYARLMATYESMISLHQTVGPLFSSSVTPTNDD